jgi:hypothetical protein
MTDKTLESPMKKHLGLIALILSLGCMACGGDENNVPNTRVDASQDARVDTRVDESGEDAQEDALGDAELDDGKDATSDPQVIPTNAVSLFAYLESDAYAALAAEPEVHGSTGPHGRVRTFINDTLKQSLDASQMSHPLGSAAIKELYSGDELRGWAVSVKVANEPNSTQNWYWYEVFSTTTNNPVADSTDAPGCSGCHGAGVDFVLSPGPFLTP